jgi:hypothetical protein
MSRSVVRSPSSPVVQASPPQEVSCHYETHPVFVSPENPEATIWRYLDFTKLISLVSTRQLFFARVDTFDDPFEGSISEATRVARREGYSELDEEKREEMLGHLRRHTEAAPAWMYANCWNLSEVESAALWGLYVQPADGVAIRSTYQHLVDSLQVSAPTTSRPHAPLWVGKVAYIDYTDDFIPDDNSLYPFVHKRKSFEFENELRAMSWDQSWNGMGKVSPIGLTVPVDLSRLIDAIYVAPTAPQWFASLVQSVVAHYGCSAPVYQSTLGERPIY